MIWAIEHDGRASGCIGLHGDHVELARAWRCDRAELGYWLAIPLSEPGLMTEAATAVTRWAFETLGLHKVTIGCIENNVGVAPRDREDRLSLLVPQLEDDVWRDGRWWAHLRYELTASEWADTTRTLRLHRRRWARDSACACATSVVVP